MDTDQDYGLILGENFENNKSYIVYENIYDEIKK